MIVEYEHSPDETTVVRVGSTKTNRRTTLVQTTSGSMRVMEKMKLPIAGDPRKFDYYPVHLEDQKERSEWLFDFKDKKIPIELSKIAQTKKEFGYKKYPLK